MSKKPDPTPEPGLPTTPAVEPPAPPVVPDPVKEPVFLIVQNDITLAGDFPSKDAARAGITAIQLTRPNDVYEIIPA